MANKKQLSAADQTFKEKLPNKKCVEKVKNQRKAPSIERRI